LVDPSGFFFKAGLKGAVIGGVTAGVTFGVGTAFGAIGSTGTLLVGKAVR
jgi:hypothetical protein